MTPNRFKEELKRFDKSLDLVYNGPKARWEIIGVDRRNRKYLIKSFGLGKIDTLGVETIRTIAEVSPGRHQTAKEVNERLDRIVKEEDKQEEKALTNSITDRLDEAWTRLQYAEGSRVSFAVTEQKKQEKTSFTITDRRRFNNIGLGKDSPSSNNDENT